MALSIFMLAIRLQFHLVTFLTRTLIPLFKSDERISCKLLKRKGRLKTYNWLKPPIFPDFIVETVTFYKYTKRIIRWGIPCLGLLLGCELSPQIEDKAKFSNIFNPFIYMLQKQTTTNMNDSSATCCQFCNYIFFYIHVHTLVDCPRGIKIMSILSQNIFFTQ